MIILETHTGLKINIVTSEVSSIHELPDHVKSKTVVEMNSGKSIFVANSYNDVMNQYNDEMGKY